MFQQKLTNDLPSTMLGCAISGGKTNKNKTKKIK
jgi:hypothetical protein